MKILLLAAGYGTRLYSLIKNKPKALLEINGKPLIQYILDRFDGVSDIDELLLVTNDKFASIFEEWAQAHEFPYPVRIINDGTKTPEDRLGSIGDIDFTLKESACADDLLIVGGDNLFDFNIKDYLSFAQAKTESVTIGLYDIGSKEEATLFGVVDVDRDKRVTSFEEKPAEPKSSLVSMCFYYLPKSTLGLIAQYLAATQKADRAGDFIRWLLKENEVYGFTFQGKWYDIGSVESYHEAQKAFPN